VLPTIFSGGDDLIVIVVAFVVLFGGSQLPKLAKNTGEALREFRKAHSEAEAGSHDAAAPAVAPGAVAPLLPAAPPVATAVTQTQTAAVPQAASASSASGDFVTLTRSQLDALLAEREAQAHAEAPKAAG
jgi:sec-independent protein translocase protein TatA